MFDENDATLASDIAKLVGAGHCGLVVMAVAPGSFRVHVFRPEAAEEPRTLSLHELQELTLALGFEYGPNLHLITHQRIPARFVRQLERCAVTGFPQPTVQ
jgi:hypothetical protein